MLSIRVLQHNSRRVLIAWGKQQQQQPTSNKRSNCQSFFSTLTSSSTPTSALPSERCDVVQGPSLLRTPGIRPHPSLLFLPGLRSLRKYTFFCCYLLLNAEIGSRFFLLLTGEISTEPFLKNTFSFFFVLIDLAFWTSDNNLPGATASSRRIAYNDSNITKVVEYLESNIETIREEYLRVSPSMISDYDSLQDHTSNSSSSTSTSTSDSSGDQHNNNDNNKSLHKGQWDWYTYMSKGNIQGHFVMKFPETSKLINEGLRMAKNNYQLFEGTPFGFVFFSSLGPGAKISPHTGPSNLRLRIHLPITAPSLDNNNNADEKTSSTGMNEKTGLPYCGIRVGNSIRSYHYNQSIVFDDAYDHEVWNDSSETRVVLLLDLWHPDITKIEKQAIVEMFQTAKRDGLWKG